MLSGFIRLITHTVELQSYTVYKLFTALRADVSQESLTLAGVWVIGEFGDVLLSAETTRTVPAGTEEDDATASATLVGEPVKESEVVDLMSNILDSPYTNTQIRQFVLTSLTKLSARFTDPVQLKRMSSLLHSFDRSVELELQSRAIEFGRLLELEGIKNGVLERMPPPEIRATVMGTTGMLCLASTLPYLTVADEESYLNASSERTKGCWIAEGRQRRTFVSLSS